MKKKNGFISMSIIYSFFAVFAIVSTSLLLIYSNNLAIVKSINKEVKKELNDKGNDLLLVFDNLIIDGSVESGGAHWQSIGSGGGSGANYYDSPIADKVLKEQQYFGNAAMAMVTSSSSYYFLVRTKDTIKLNKNHYYYITRVYQSWNHTRGDVIQLYFMSKSLSSKFTPSNQYQDVIKTPAENATKGTKSFDILANARGYYANTSNTKWVYETTDINKSRHRRESGWCAGVNGRAVGSGCESGTYANTLESGIFKFTGETGDYYLVTGADFSNWSSKANPFVSGYASDGTGCTKLCGLAPRYYTDGYMLFDLNVAFQLDEAAANTALSDEQTRRCKSRWIDNLLDARYIEGRKEFAAHRVNITMSCTLT